MDYIPEFDDNDLYEENSNILDMTNVTNDQYINIDPYTLSLYNISVLKKALKLGYDVDKQNNKGVTLLHCYVRKKPTRSVMNRIKLILSYGAIPFIPTKKCVCVLDIAMRYNRPIAKMLITKYNVPANDFYKKILKIKPQKN